jgi:hypothetical protein
MSADHPPVIAVVVVALILAAVPGIAVAQGETRGFSNVMYLGGAAGVRGKSLEWDNNLTVSPEKISFSGKKVRFEIDTRSVRRLNYRGHEHINDGATGAGLAAAGLLGALVGSRVRSTDHYLEIEYVLADGSPSALLLRLHKDNQQQIIDAMHAATGIAK